jgi:hypothetical protein
MIARQRKVDASLSLRILEGRTAQRTKNLRLRLIGNRKLQLAHWKADLSGTDMKRRHKVSGCGTSQFSGKIF